jgi:hypothetical protein
MVDDSLEWARCGDDEGDFDVLGWLYLGKEGNGIDEGEEGS